jgi:hypothetical protein
LRATGSWQKTLLWVSMYSISMGFLECAVVVYLRTIYFPQGFGFPLSLMSENIAVTELMREVATIIMLLSIGFIAGDSFLQRFAFFIYSFAIWDIFYYIFLRLILAWPASFMTWDVLFLIPVSWTSPVIAPLIVSITMIILALFILVGTGRNKVFKIGRICWSFLITGSFIIILSFVWDYSRYMLENYTLIQIVSIPENIEAQKYALNYIPRNFNWLLFMLGELIIISGLGISILQYRNDNKLK